ncbi:conserved hypothetical protein [Vibrio nigripulchritudo MADA3029]|uniref:Uncharacterized protein n=1 Tax=Vibrio nigripulchritudo SOn1 TaxID=1238450 RepID=A0AAV2VZN3_9VIBR|nr:hypothetical protein [Vibrio nigripulchritudo]EGU61501.1 hypothetical protein VINI7043_25617 [Vibrio nigripulchritudo ATCC 27043]KJY66510.1 hypothetical protein TW74_28000 [Vibrio nigripulchritudo]CCN33817.1 conserved hypothetical protein [Vibrio nigripulchritudo AM115]CCN43587.1 conserved hypothetical protein [Vibrio nigripulchritudo FTn2]CCN49284.1 conserved hypothetical protein [Vibrio nigripulchritudo MADA3020]
MSKSAIPSTYHEWRHCITVDCGIPLTTEYVEQRIEALQSDRDEHTKQFVKLYGDQYRQQVVNWFKEAQAELANG